MHKQFILAALEQAKLGQGKCSPNPSVGAVAVHDNKIIAHDWHKGVGTAHAEEGVLQQLPPKLDNVTLYVTLEPCNHWGRTPPCVDAIIRYGIKRVVYGFCDPNPVVKANNTPNILANAGIEAIYYSLPEINTFYQSYQYWVKYSKPFVTAKIAHTLDGKIAKTNGERVQLSNELCAEFTHNQRAYTDVILTSERTIRNDNPLLNNRLQKPYQKKAIAIIDSSLALQENANIYSTAAHCHIFYNEQLSVKKPQQNCSYHPLPLMADNHLDLTALISFLGKLGFHDVWVEAGGILFSALHHQGLVQKTYLYIVPDILGDNAISGFHGNDIFKRQHTISWLSKENNMIACLEWQEDLCLQE